jgi:hypothetical protein
MGARVGTAMIYRLSSIGDHIGEPVVRVIHSLTIEGARQAALDLLDQYPTCEAVEIFEDERFIQEVARRPH